MIMEDRRWSEERSPRDAVAPVLAVGILVIVLLLTWPMSIRQPGDHEDGTCGVPVWMDLSAYPDPSVKIDGAYYGAIARQRCTDARDQRFAWSGVVAALTAGVALLVRPRRTAEKHRRSLRDGPDPTN
jgi:hypothetical protein